LLEVPEEIRLVERCRDGLAGKLKYSGVACDN
jgi:hypothetical protein